MSELLPPIRITLDNFQQLAEKVRSVSRTVPETGELVRRIVADVRKEGDEAILRYTRQFDGASLAKSDLQIPFEEIDRSVGRVSEEVLSALRLSLQRIKAVQQELLDRVTYSQELDGFKIRVAPSPLSSVGCYVPGGRASYASTVLMTAGVAKLAGVKRIVLCTPPNSSGGVGETVLAAASLCGVDEVYRIGGAQSIAALAYGTETIRKVEKIIGPGGVYVALAKKIVSADVTVDFFAGPTELLVVADETADPKIAAWDLIAQAEHGEEGVCGVVTWSGRTAEKIRSEINRLIPSVSRRKFVETCLRRGFSAVCDDRKTASAFVNAVASEHLELLIDGAEEFAETVQAAGLVLLGPYSPCAASDYCIGTNHVLPTNGFASVRGGLSVLDFVKLMWIVEGSPAGLRSVLQAVQILASAEGLPNHHLSLSYRFQK